MHARHIWATHPFVFLSFLFFFSRTSRSRRNCFLSVFPSVVAAFSPTLGRPFHGDEPCLNLNANLNFRG